VAVTATVAEHDPHVVGESREDAWLVLRPACDALGLDEEAQRTRLVRSPWASASIMEAHDASGRKQRMFCVQIDTVPIWVATTETSRVRLDIREKLLRCQRGSGLGESAQRQRLQRPSWAVAAMTASTGPDGRRNEHSCVCLDTAPIGLATIDTDRVRPSRSASSWSATGSDQGVRRPLSAPEPSGDGFTPVLARDESRERQFLQGRRARLRASCLDCKGGALECESAGAPLRGDPGGGNRGCHARG
jgi:hypothetical protein